MMTARTTIGKLIHGRIESEIERMLAFRDEAGAGEHSESIHQMRVSARRLRGLFRAFSPILPKQLTALEPELAWIAASLGAVRDLDVLKESYPPCASKIDKARAPLLEILRCDLDSARFASLVAALRDSKDSSFREATLADSPVATVAPDILRLQFRRVQKLLDSSEPGEVHMLRKRAKRLRYVADCFLEFYGKPASRFLQALKELQDHLGKYQDDVVAAKLLAELDCPVDVTPSVAFLGDALSKVVKRWKKLARTMKREREAIWKLGKSGGERPETEVNENGANLPR